MLALQDAIRVVDPSRVTAYSFSMALQLTPALEQRLDQLASQTHRTHDELAPEGMEKFLDYE